MKNEIVSIDVVLTDLKNEREFLENYTRNFQQHYEVCKMIWNYERQERHLERLTIILNNPTSLN